MESRGLNIIVVGAGIGGLSTAIALGREGHQVTVGITMHFLVTSDFFYFFFIFFGTLICSLDSLDL